MTFNHNNVYFVQNLGYIIDSEWDSYDSINPIYQNLKSAIQNYNLLENHDFAIDSMHLDKLLETLSMPDYYYSYVKKVGDLLFLMPQTMHIFKITHIN